MNGDPYETAARTVWGEARGESFAGMLAVAHVIKNRVDNPRWWGNTVETVCRKPEQFSCWNENDPNLPLVEAATELQLLKAREAVSLVFDKMDKDPTNGANHYHARGVNPPWVLAKQPCAIVGKHLFYKL